jgi:hypothetical protein
MRCGKAGVDVQIADLGPRYIRVRRELHPLRLLRHCKSWIDYLYAGVNNLMLHNQHHGLTHAVNHAGQWSVPAWGFVFLPCSAVPRTAVPSMADCIFTVYPLQSGFRSYVVIDRLSR